MATINVEREGANELPGEGAAATFTWEDLSEADVAEAVTFEDFADRSAQVSGLAGGNAVSIQGSNDGDTWYELSDPQGNGLLFLADGLKQIVEMTKFIRPEVLAGAGVLAKVVIFARRGRV